MVILGGAKVSDKLGTDPGITVECQHDRYWRGNGLHTATRPGSSVGKSLVEASKREEVRELLKEATRRDVTVLLPEDHVIAAGLQAGASYLITPGREIPEDKIGVDIGPQTIKSFSSAIRSARTIFWNGPMGVFETPPFDRGTRAVAEAVAGSQTFSVAGGGDTIAALNQTRLSDKVSHISTGGGASLEFLETGDLPGIAALREPADSKQLEKRRSS